MLEKNSLKINLIISPLSIESENYDFTLIKNCYQLWKNVWSDTLKELDGLNTLYSDGFSRQDFITVITIDDEIAGLCCFKNMNLKDPFVFDDSWFSPWPKDLLNDLSKYYSKALIPSWLTVNSKFRRSHGYTEHNITSLLLELISINCLHSKFDIAFGTPRKDRSVNKLITQAGAETLLNDVIHHNVLIDLVAFYPNKLKIHKFSKTIEDLWHNRIDLRINTTNRKENYYETNI